MIRTTGVILTALSVILMIYSIFIINKMKRYFNDFYNANKCSIVTASLTLFIPLMIRGVFDMCTGFIVEIYYFFDEHHEESELVLQASLYLLGQFIPLMA
jgi:predicted membrane protein